MDEPTVVGRRPIGPTRGTQQRQQPFGAVPLAQPEPGPRVVGGGSMPDQGGDSAAAGNELFAQIALEPKSPDDALVTAAAPLFLVVAQLRNMVENADVNALRRKIVEQMRRFEERAVRYNARGGDVSAARYVMSALIDEAVMTTPWGSASAWSDNSLLNQFHNETWGGEKVFQILERVQGEPAKYLALLKLLDLCLLMGFEGKYRVVAGGRERLEDLREELGRTLRQHTPAPSEELSPQWKGIAATRGVRRYLPLWIVFTICTLLALIFYGFFRWRLSGDLTPVEQMLDLIGGGGPL
jgi:type VI secretion system protein ImpK